MKLIERLLVGLLLVIAAGIVVHAPLTVWLGTQYPDAANYIKSWKEILMAVALILFVIIAWRTQKVGGLLRDRLMQLALVYAGIHFMMIAIFQDTSYGAGLLIDLRFVLYFVLVYGTLKILPDYRKLLLTAFAGGAAAVLIFALLQIFVLPRDFLANIGYSRDTIAPFLTVDKNPDYIRINSTLRGPNPLGAYVVIVASVIFAYAVKYREKLADRKKWLVLGGAVAAGLVIGATYSRASVIGLGVALIIVAMSVVTIHARKVIATGLITALVVVLAVVVIGREHPLISNVVWHDNPTGGSAVDSNEGHADSLVDGFMRMVRQPLGAGVGSTGSASLDSDNPLIIENQYLFIAHEVGWIGLAVFVWLFVEVMKKLWQRRTGALALGVFASGCGIAVIGILHPVWVDDTVSIVWWGLAGIAAATEVRRRHGKRTRN